MEAIKDGMQSMNTEKYVMLKHKLGESLILRYMYLPIITIKEFYISHIYYKQYDRDRIKAFKNRYKGKRCFIVGNGPSLNETDLELLMDEYTFATNKIYDIFEKTNWRPSFYVCVDPIQLAENMEDIKNMPDTIKFISCRANLMDDNCYRINDKRYYVINPYVDYKVEFSWEADRYITTHSTVAYVAMQLAVYMGFDEIVLLGFDHNFKVMTDKNNRMTVNEKVIKNHFAGQRESDQNIVFDANGANRDYEALKNAASTCNIKIINATRGGCLEVFQRKNLEEVLGLD